MRLAKFGFAHRLAITSILLLGTAPAFAADLPVFSKIDAVSVYPDGATITRTLDFDAPSGESVLVARDLPAGLDPASIRVDARDADGIAISGIDAASVLTDAALPDAQTDKALRDLHDKRDTIDAQGKALVAKQGLIEHFASTASFDSDKQGLDVNVLRGAWNAVGDDLGQVNEAIRQNGLQLRDIDEAIARLEAARDGRPEGQQHTQVRISFTTDRPAKGKLTLSYIIGGAGWTPLYDARLDSSTGKLEITRRAKVAQTTGEDWSDVALTISTAHAAAGASVPKLDSTVLNFVEYDAEPPAPQAMAAPTTSAGGTLDKRAITRDGEALRRVPVAGKEVEAAVNTGGFQSVWVLPNRVSVPSGNDTKSLRLASTTITPDIVARAAPALQETAYLEASFTNQDDTPLFPGAVSIYRDGLYAGQATMPLATKTEPVRLGFGADDRIKIDRVVTRKVGADTGYSHPMSSEKRDYKITVRNGRPTPIKIAIEEAVPVSENKDIKVEPSSQMTPANTKDIDNRRGIQIWTLDLAPGDTKDINFGYKVTWPGDEAINLD